VKIWFAFSAIIFACVGFAQTNYSVSPLATAPILDGDLSEWQNAESITVDSSLVTDKTAITDDSDLSITAYLGQDAKNLYLAALVKDDALVFERSGDTLYETDGLEFWLNETQFMVALSDGKAVLHRFSFSGVEVDIGLMQHAIVTTDDGYNVEVAIPLELLATIITEPDTFAFAIGADDADEEGGTAAGQLYYPKGWVWKETSTYSTVTLSSPITPVTPTPSSPSADTATPVNLLGNNDFADASGTSWAIGLQDSAEAEGSIIDGEYCTVISAAGDNPWSIALRQGSVNLEPGNYQLSLDAYSSEATELGIKLGQSVDPFAEYFFKAQPLTTEKTTYSFAAEITTEDPEAGLELFMGGANTPTVPTTVCVDNIQLVQASVEAEARKIPYIMVDQFGYRPNDTKVAVLVDPQIGFNAADSYEPSTTLELRNTTDDSVVFSGDITVWNDGATQANSGDKGWWFDFSSITEPGSYYLIDPVNDMRSYDFEIGEDVYQNVLTAALRMFYYNRANLAKEEPYADARWTDGVSYVGTGQDSEVHFVEDKSNDALVKDLSGGWFDAGDTNKYVTFAMSPVHVLLTAFEENPEAFTDDLTIPESGNGLPDVIDELKWELDWLQKMQAEDGGVIIKMGDIDYTSPSPWSSDTGPRFYGPVCSSSSIAAASMFAHAALVFAKLPDLADYATDLQERAVRAYDWYEKNPKRDDCDTGEIKAGDADDAIVEQEANKVVAAVYLFALTDEEKYKLAVEANYRITRPFNDGGKPRWSVYDPEQGDALLYYTGLDKADPALAQTILATKLEQAIGASSDMYGFQANQDLYRAYIRDESYHWGSNFARAGFANSNLDMLHYQLATPLADYQERARGILHYFHGVNPFNMVYLSNMIDYGAEYSANEIYHTWFNDGTPWDNALTSERGPAPGYVPGGPNQNYSGDVTPPLGEPAQKSYRDWNGPSGQPWEITEPAIYYQANYIRLLANFVAKVAQ
jgi:endoglucanase